MTHNQMDLNVVGSEGSGSPRKHADKFEKASSTDLGEGYLKETALEPVDGGNGVREGSEKINYHTLSWIQTAFVLIAETVSLGILSLPSTLDAVGLVPGVILLIFLGLIATYTGYVIGQFKVKYPHVTSFADAGEIIGGNVGWYICAIGQTLFLIFVMAAHILSFSIMMNVLTDHATCTIVWTIVGMAVSLICTLPRTIQGMTGFSYISSASVLTAVFICMVGVGVNAPDHVVFNYFNQHTKFYQAFGAVTNIIFAYAGHVAFFTVFSEMKEPKDFWKSIMVLQVLEIILYTVTAVVIYRYTGHGVKSPALGSTTRLLSKIAYGFASPTIVVAGVINGQVAVKFVFELFGKKRPGLVESKGAQAWTIWIMIVTVMWVVGWIIASAIPVFNHLLGLISAIFLSWFTYGLSGYFWLFMNKGRWTENWKKLTLTVINFVCIILGFVIMGLGLYSSIYGMKMDTSSTGSFSCADNSL